MGRFLLGCCAVLLVAGCSSSSRPSVGPIGPARTYELSRFAPVHVAHPGPARLSFTIRRPSAPALTDYKRGAAPHTVTLRAPKRIHPIEATTLTAKVADPSGKPVVFHPWFGALAHAIFFRQGSLDYFHTHVCGPSTPGCTSVLGGAKVVGRPAGPGQLHIGLLLPIAGTWRLFLQFRDRGRVVTAPFTLRVQ